MALGIKKITESVVEDKRALTTIGTYMPAQLGSANDIISDIPDNRAIDNGGLFTATTIDREGRDAGIIRIKTSLNKQGRIDAERTLSLETIVTDLIADSAITTSKIKNAAVTDTKLATDSVITVKIKNRNVTSSKIAIDAILNEHLSDGCVHTDNIKDGAITTNKIADEAVTNVKLSTNSVSTDKIRNNAVTRDKLSESLRKELDGLRKDIDDLDAELEQFKRDMNTAIENLNNTIKELEASLKKEIILKIDEFKNKYKLDNAVVHNGTRSVGKNHGGGSTELINLHCTGDIQGNRVYYMTYQDLAEAYMPGEHLEPGDIVAMREDGLVYRAESTDPCIVGVISDEFANCLGATREEIFLGLKVAVGTIGKVHVKVKGPVRLGQQINVSLSDPGIGYATSSLHGVGKALETIDCDFDEINDVFVQIRPM